MKAVASTTGCEDLFRSCNSFYSFFCFRLVIPMVQIHSPSTGFSLHFPAHWGEALIPLRPQGYSQLHSHHALSMCGLLQRLTSRCAIFAQRAIVKTLIAGGREQADNACRAVAQASAAGAWRCCRSPPAGAIRSCLRTGLFASSPLIAGIVQACLSYCRVQLA